jgi:hypothetical protein
MPMLPINKTDTNFLLAAPPVIGAAQVNAIPVNLARFAGFAAPATPKFSDPTPMVQSARSQPNVKCKDATPNAYAIWSSLSFRRFNSEIDLGKRLSYFFGQ